MLKEALNKSIQRKSLACFIWIIFQHEDLFRASLIDRRHLRLIEFFTGSAEDLFEHLRGQDARARIVTGAMIAIEEHYRLVRQMIFRPMHERKGSKLEAQGPQNGLMGNAAKGDNDIRLIEMFQRSAEK